MKLSLIQKKKNVYANDHFGDFFKKCSRKELCNYYTYFMRRLQVLPMYRGTIRVMKRRSSNFFLLSNKRKKWYLGEPSKEDSIWNHHFELWTFSIALHDELKLNHQMMPLIIALLYISASLGVNCEQFISSSFVSRGMTKKNVGTNWVGQSLVWPEMESNRKILLGLPLGDEVGVSIGWWGLVFWKNRHRTDQIDF